MSARYIIKLAGFPNYGDSYLGKFKMTKNTEAHAVRSQLMYLFACVDFLMFSRDAHFCEHFPNTSLYRNYKPNIITRDRNRRIMFT